MENKDRISDAGALHIIQSFITENGEYIEGFKKQTIEDLKTKSQSLSKKWLQETIERIDDLFEVYAKPQLLLFSEAVKNQIIEDFNKLKIEASEASKSNWGPFIFESYFKPLMIQIFNNIKRFRIKGFEEIKDRILNLPRVEAQTFAAHAKSQLNTLKRDKKVLNEKLSIWQEYAIDWSNDLTDFIKLLPETKTNHANNGIREVEHLEHILTTSDKEKVVKYINTLLVHLRVVNESITSLPGVKTGFISGIVKCLKDDGFISPISHEKAFKAFCLHINRLYTKPNTFGDPYDSGYSKTQDFIMENPFKDFF